MSKMKFPVFISISFTIWSLICAFWVINLEADTGYKVLWMTFIILSFFTVILLNFKKWRQIKEKESFWYFLYPSHRNDPPNELDQFWEQAITCGFIPEL